MAKTFGTLPDERAFKPTPCNRAAVASMVAHEAQRQGLPVKLALRVAQVESGRRCDAIGPKTRHGRPHVPRQ